MQGQGGPGQDGNQVAKNQTQKIEQVHPEPGAEITKRTIDPRYRALTCYNCGEPGHFVGIYTKPKICFLCTVPGHYMNECPFWKRQQPIATYLGSASAGMGFYHIDLPDTKTTRWLNLSNCAIVKVKRGEISMVELEKELTEIFCKEWPWQIREITLARFLVRFPPHRKVSDLKSLPSFNLRKEGVQVKVMEWVEDLDHFSELKEVWITLEGIPPKWCDCKVFSQMAYSFGMLVDVDWSSLFKSFYEKVRMKVACRNPWKIPMERLFEMDKELYLISIQVEGFEQEEADKTDMDDDDGLDDFGNEDQQEEEDVDKPDQQEMDTKKTDGHKGTLSAGKRTQSDQKG
jgi:hypothetical protein